MKKHRNIFFTLLFSILLLVSSDILAQESGSNDAGIVDDSRDVPVLDVPADMAEKRGTADEAVSSPVREKKDTVRIVAAADNRKTAEKKKEPEAAENSGQAVSGSLLPIRDGDYKYVRIPGIGITMKPTAAATDIVTMPQEKPSEISGDNKSGKGLFGLSGKATDMVVRGFIVVLIVFIFILYRMRSRGSSRGVMRNFPNR